MFVYSGNDYVDPNDTYDAAQAKMWTTPLADRPRPSLLGKVAPELAWVVADRMRTRAAAAASGVPVIPGEAELFATVCKRPFEEGVELLTEHMHKHYFPDQPREKIKEVLGRGGPAFWAAFQERQRDCEYLQPWILNQLLTWELKLPGCPRSVAEVHPAAVGPNVEATLTWLKATHRHCQKAGVPFKIFLEPVGLGDPEFVAFWKIWPEAFSWNYTCHARHQAMLQRLRMSGIPVVDLWPVLDGQPLTYRKSDQHWNEKGHQIVSERVLEELRQDLALTGASAGR
jgi:hypothetical protein